MMEEQAIPAFWLVSTGCYQEKDVWIREDVPLLWPSAKSTFSILHLSCALEK